MTMEHIYANSDKHPYTVVFCFLDFGELPCLTSCVGVGIWY